MRNPKGAFERALEAMQKTGDAVLAWQYQKAMIKQSLLDKQEREALVNEITAKVISNIKATVDVSEILLEIEQLRKAIDDLGNGGRA